MNIFDDVAAFHKKAGQVTPKELSLSSENYKHHKRLVEEEYGELSQAILMSDALGIAKEAIDLIYVVVGLLLSMGVNPKRAWQLVHDSNMQKMEPNVVKDSSGKIQKPQGWVPPDMTKTLVARKDIAYFRKCSWQQLDDGWYLQTESGETIQYCRELWIHYIKEGSKARLFRIRIERDVKCSYYNMLKVLQEAQGRRKEDTQDIEEQTKKIKLLCVEFGRPEDINTLTDEQTHDESVFLSLGRIVQ